MPLQDFDGDTWVAFSDLCGTKEMLAKSRHKAANALGRFYQTVYDLHDVTQGISCLAVSDCAIFWLHGEAAAAYALDSLLNVLKDLHQRMAQAKYLVSTSVAWGAFSYQQRLELPHLRKDMVAGGAYMDAYAKNKDLLPGSIGIVNCPDNRWSDDFCPQTAPFLTAGPAGFKKSSIWWVDSHAEVSGAKQRQKQANESRFQALLEEYNRSRGRLT